MISRRVVPAAMAAPALAQAAIGEGPARITFAEPSAGGEMPVWLHRPAAWRPGGPVVAVLHGAGRTARGYRDTWAVHAEQRGFLLVCPEFSQAAYPGSAAYNDGASAGRPPEAWSFWALPRAVAAARRAVGEDAAPAGRFHLYGHSAGSQFSHRYNWLCDAEGVDRMVFANAGFYTWPDITQAFPYGLAGTMAGEAALRRGLARPVVVLLGEQDVSVTDPDLRQTPEAMRQGPHRFGRGQAFFAAAREAAARLGVPFGWRMAFVPGVGHSNAGMAPRAVEMLFD